MMEHVNTDAEEKTLALIAYMANEEHGVPFSDLHPEEQDEIKERVLLLYSLVLAEGDGNRKFDQWAMKRFKERLDNY